MSKTGHYKDITGLKFGKLTAIKRIGNDKYNTSVWFCKCECGKTVNVKLNNLKSGNTQSCGCIHQEKISKLFETHGLTNTRLYHILSNMKGRCYNKNVKDYKNYGGKKIIICDEWLNDFMNFYNWSMENGYKEELSIDRKDVTGNYEPSNCRWADMVTQENNRTNNRLIVLNGITKTLSEWTKFYGLKHSTVANRITRHWSVEDWFKPKGYRRLEVKINE